MYLGIRPKEGKEILEDFHDVGFPLPAVYIERWTANILDDTEETCRRSRACEKTKIEIQNLWRITEIVLPSFPFPVW